MPQKRIEYIDIAKGLGIIFVVWGHTGFWGSIQVNLFHMSLFFFISGLTFNVNKSVRNMIIGKLKSCYLPYIGFSLSAFIINCFLGYCKILTAQTITPVTIIKKMIKIVLFMENQELFQPMWFLFSLFCSSILVSIIVHTKFWSKMNKMLQTSFGVLLWIMAYVFSIKGYTIEYCGCSLWTILQGTAIIMITICWRKYIKFNNIWIAFLGLIVVCVTKNMGLRVDFRVCQYEKVYLFPIMILCSLYMCIYFSKILNKTIFSNLFCLIGQSSMWIMSLHFTVFCLIGVVQRILTNYPAEYYENIVHSYLTGIWAVIGIVLGVMIPTFVRVEMKIIKNKICNKFRNNVHI